MKKTVNVVGHAFDCLPGHVTINGRGSGSTLRVATREAVADMLADPRLRRKRVGEFKLSAVVVESEEKTNGI